MNTLNGTHEGRLLIGWHGQAQVGKDTAAKYLAEKYGFKSIAFAEPLRSEIYAMNPLVNIPGDLWEEWIRSDDDFALPEVEYYDPMEDVYVVRAQSLVDAVGYERAKQAPEYRGLLQRRGDQAGRRIHGEDFWVGIAFRRVGPDDRLVQFTDVRYDNEAEAIREAGGYVGKIWRPYEARPAVPEHDSENGISPHLIDFGVQNTGTIEEFHRKIETALRDRLGLIF